MVKSFSMLVQHYMKKVCSNRKGWFKAGLLLQLLLLFSTQILAQTGPGGIGSIDGSSALHLWLDASRGLYADTLQKKTSQQGDKVMYWKDLSGSGNDVASVSDTTSPLFTTASNYFNNQPALRFSRYGTTSKRTFLVSKSFSKTNDITIYCIYHALTKAGGNNVTPFTATTYDKNMWYYGSGLVDGGSAGFVNDISLAFCDSSLAAGSGDSTIATDYCVKIPTSINETYIAILQKEAWSGRLKLASNLTSDAIFQAGKQPINNSSRYFIGSTSDAWSAEHSPFFDGYIGGVLIYNKILNAAEKIILENYLAARYNLKLKNDDLYAFDDPQSGDYDFEVVGIGKASDGTAQLTAKGEGIVQVSSTDDFSKNNFLFIGHNGKVLNQVTDDLPEGVQFRSERKWAVAVNFSSITKVDIVLDPKDFAALNTAEIGLLIDTDNDGSFKDEKIGEGILTTKQVSAQGKILFQNVVLKNGNLFAFSKMKPTCLEDCESYFTPNGDGVLDVYFLPNKGITSVIDINGKTIRNISSPGYWDGTDEHGQLSDAGIYFLITDKHLKTTVTLIR